MTSLESAYTFLFIFHLQPVTLKTTYPYCFSTVRLKLTVIIDGLCNEEK